VLYANWCFTLHYITLHCFVVPPTIGDHAYKDKIILKAGTSTAIEIPFLGSPQPSAKWSFKGGKLPDAKRFKVETIANMTSMTMSKVVRSDSGKYTVELQSDVGKAKVDIEVVVLGKISHQLVILIYDSLAG